jgi:hypothetical protein
MDLLDLIITIAILGVGGLLSGKSSWKTARRQRAAGIPGFDDETQRETIFEEESEDEDYSFDVKEEDSQVNNEIFENSYFTYEAEPTQQWKQEQKIENVQGLEVTAKDEPMNVTTLLGETFDLRKAFIYQTILERVEY